MPERRPQRRTAVSTIVVFPPGDDHSYEVPVPMTAWVAEQLVTGRSEAWWGLIAFVDDMISEERARRREDAAA